MNSSALDCRLPLAFARALNETFGVDTSQVAIKPHALRLKWHGRAVATTRKNTIYLRGSMHSFLSDPELVLHEYFHVLRHWATGRLTRRSYLAECCKRGYVRNRFEVEARQFAAAERARFEQCLAKHSCAPAFARDEPQRAAAQTTAAQPRNDSRRQ